MIIQIGHYAETIYISITHIFPAGTYSFGKEAKELF